MYRRSLSLRNSTVGPNSPSSLYTMTALAGTLVQVHVLTLYITLNVYMITSTSRSVELLHQVSVLISEVHHSAYGI
jgi:hypothetical protein